MGTVAFAVKMPKTSKAAIKPTLFQPLNQLMIEWNHRESTNIQRLKNIHIHNPYTTLSYNPIKATIATFLAEVAFFSLRGERQGDLFPFFQTSMLWLDNASKGYENFHMVFLLRISCYLGFEPSTINPQLPYFDLMNGAYVTTQPVHNFYLHSTDARHIPLFMRLRYHNMHLLRLTHTERMRALKIITTYLRLHIPSFPKIKSLDIIDKILGD